MSGGGPGGPHIRAGPRRGTGLEDKKALRITCFSDADSRWGGSVTTELGDS